MAFAFPQAGNHQPPPAAHAASGLKVPAALSPAKGTTVPAAVAKFQALLDQAAHPRPKAPSTPVPGAPAVKAASADPASLPKVNLKAKTSEVSLEKPKDPKKTDKPEAKDHRSEAAEAAAGALLAAGPRAEAPKPAPKAGEGLEAPGAEKAKTPVKAGARPGAEVPAAVTAASAEIARSQAQQSSPRGERSEDKQKVFVVDRRSEKEKERIRAGAETTATTPVHASAEVASQPKTPDAKTPPEVQVSFQAVAGKAKEGFDLKPGASNPTPKDALSFQQYLVDKGYGQLVDQARVVLKDQNAGEIRMTLFPESLGKVKVSLNLNDNTLAGQIFVENQTVKDVFQSNMDGLLQAFSDGGWNDVSLQVSVGGEGGAGTSHQGAQNGAPARDYGRQVGQSPTVEGRSDRYGSWTDRQVNLTA